MSEIVAMSFQLFLLLSLLSTGLSMVTNEAGSGVVDFCPMKETSCKFTWNVVQRQSMMYYDGVLAYPVVWRNGSFYYRTQCADDTMMVQLNDTELAKVYTIDGDYQYVTTINDMFPGPSVVAYEGQVIEIEVKNELLQEGTGIHWHGMKQLNTNWMDGVPGTTQCPINPQETFTYRFIASPAGTHWYHSHSGSQRSDGLFGAFIVKPHPNRTPKQPVPNLPNFDKEFIMMVSENEVTASDQIMTSFMSDLKQFMFDGWNNTGYCFGGSKKAPNGVSAATFRFRSGLFNGKGHQFDANGNAMVDVPLETFVVQPDNHYRFRVINTASHYAFKISVDEHPMVLIASDGQDIIPVLADGFYINAGERFDFYIYTNQTAASKNYYIRSETIEFEPHQGVAILRYNGSSTTEKPTTTDTCMSRNCTIVNCPFPYFIRGPHVGATCINFESIYSAYPYNGDIGSGVVEHFISFEKTDSPYNRQYDTAQGVMYITPSTPPTVIGTAMYDNDCRNRPECATNPCRCTNQINLPLGRMVQIVLLSNTTHPIHLHGHYFEVMKIGYPPAGHDNVTFKALEPNQDVVCNNHLCNNATWSNSSWLDGNIPGMNTVNPARKDTITIPAGGYVVLRFRTDNPGWWLMHCHIDSHFKQGMGILFQAGTDGEMTLRPRGFKTCGTYKLNQVDFTYAMSNTVNGAKTGNGGSNNNNNNINIANDGSWTDREKKLAFGYIGAVAGGFLVGIVFTLCCQYHRANAKK